MTETPESPQSPEPAAASADGARVEGVTPSHDAPAHDALQHDAPQHDAPQHGRGGGRRRWVVLGVVGGLVLVGGGATAAVLASREPTAPVTPPAVTITNPVPTPAAAPAAREESTALVAALPDAVLQWAFAGVVQEEGPRGALETYRVTYTDGAAGEVVLRVTQMRDAAAAGEVAGRLAGAFAEATPDGAALQLPVMVGGQAASEATVRTSPTAAGAATWVNGTVALHAEGPSDSIEDFFRAFPM